MCKQVDECVREHWECVCVLCVCVRVHVCAHAHLNCHYLVSLLCPLFSDSVPLSLLLVSSVSFLPDLLDPSSLSRHPLPSILLCDRDPSVLLAPRTPPPWEGVEKGQGPVLEP